jgi:hypothetical protein
MGCWESVSGTPTEASWCRRGSLNRGQRLSEIYVPGFLDNAELQEQRYCSNNYGKQQETGEHPLLPAFYVFQDLVVFVCPSRLLRFIKSALTHTYPPASKPLKKHSLKIYLAKMRVGGVRC